MCGYLRSQVDGCRSAHDGALLSICGAGARRHSFFGASSIAARQRPPKGNRLVKTTNHGNDVERTPGRPAATRMRLHRRRRRQRIRCVTVQLHELEVEALVRKGWLTAEMRNDPAALVDALHGHLGYSLLGERDV